MRGDVVRVGDAGDVGVGVVVGVVEVVSVMMGAGALVVEVGAWGNWARSWRKRPIGSRCCRSSEGSCMRFRSGGRLW